MIIDGVKVTVAGFEPHYDELKSYVEYVKERESDVVSVAVKLHGDDFVDLDYTACHTKFERLRRITGYLTSDLRAWNDSKRAEERDRLKHI